MHSDAKISFYTDFGEGVFEESWAVLGMKEVTFIKEGRK